MMAERDTDEDDKGKAWATPVIDADACLSTLALVESRCGIDADTRLHALRFYYVSARNRRRHVFTDTCAG